MSMVHISKVLTLGSHVFYVAFDEYIYIPQNKFCILIIIIFNWAKQQY